ncbi:penicillin-binding protein 1C [Chelativorans sp. ZYF759]|uniref:penicillin-binding protein 1C n=1 Tax=Chelativorans sp. ZYF759 TaxID=2692213 RepID=UPI00145E36FE|nr:penicillin-binding protein 1C [Chelativorans sp. ZYF759]NMG37835.1 penicillin-binding protein 1C [Chelativorans sp. ZYF759]
MATLSRWRMTAVLSAGLLFLVGAALVTLDVLDRAHPPPLEALAERSVEVVDRDGRLLRAYAVADGRWRLGTDLAEIDPVFLDMLVAYEDGRFRSHFGIDPLALLRAAGQFAANGRIVSGGSTITMQLARLIEPREARSMGAKLRQMVRALQIERRLSKDEILALYLALAPYGGNLEGVRAASLAWFGKEPRRLELDESALLVALPQLPERRRPDRNADAAEEARDRVLARMVSAGLVPAGEAARAAEARVPDRRLAMPAFAPHAADEALRALPADGRHSLTLSRPIQESLERVAREAAEKLGPRISVAILMADASTGEILARVGSPDFLDDRRSGWIDMTRAVRSPGSTLKPFIYGLAIEEGLVAQETMIEDRPANFAGYRPRNFDMAYQGDVSVRTALQLSLNVPAVHLLDAVGPARLAARFRRVGVSPVLPRDGAPGLAIALGGAGVTLSELVQLYTGLSNGGRAVQLTDRPGGSPARREMLAPRAAWHVADMLAGVNPPEGASRRGIAYKTGTSYGYRDAWSVGFDGRHVIGVWVGRADAAPVPGISGYATAAPILFTAFQRSGVAATPLARAPAGAVRLARDELPVTLRRFVSVREAPGARLAVEPPPEIVFPPDGARVELATSIGRVAPLVLKLQGGRAPFRWLANGRAVSEPARARTSQWQPDGRGQSTLTVIDAAGRAATVRVHVD